MRRLRFLAPVVAFAGALAPLLLLDGDRRALGFRAYGLTLGVLALRAVLTFTAESGAPPPDSPFERRRRLPMPRRRQRRRRSAHKEAHRSNADHLATSATDAASAFHFRLRPLLRQAADERLRAHHGIGLDDAAHATAVADLLGPVAHDHLRADRPPPHDRRGPGVDAATLAAILTTVENL